MTLYVRLKADYYDDDQFINAGSLAEVLYVRALGFSKVRMQDGHVSREQLKRFAIGINQPLRHARKLCEVGLWAETDTGFQIVDWLKWNKSAAEIEEERQVARDAGERGNHERWHIGPEGKPSAKCRLCREARRRTVSGNPIGDPIANPIGGTNRGRSPETETETETEPKEETETESAYIGETKHHHSRTASTAWLTNGIEGMTQ